MRDPGHLILRRSVRAAAVIPLTFWFVQIVLGLPNSSLSAAFAGIAILIFADFGGPSKQRLLANVWVGIAGIVLVYSTLFCIGKALFGDYLQATVFFFAAVISSVTINRILSKVGFKNIVE